MNDFSRDELASAYLDGEVTAEERALVEADPGLLQRAQELESARDALRTAPVEPISPVAREAAIAAALDATVVVSLETHRARRGLRVASIAAALLVALGAGALVVQSQQDSSTTKSTAVAAAPTTTAAERNAAGAATAGQAAGGTGFASASRASLGSFVDRPELVDAARRQVSEQALSGRSADSPQTTVAPSAPAEGAADAAAACAPSARPNATEVYAASALLNGRSVTVDVFRNDDGTVVLVVTDASTCVEVFSQPL
jgi:hypothetical protein